MKKSLTRKLTIAVIALVFAVVSLSTSTYAWFTISNTAQIENFEAQVILGDGIEIAVTNTQDVGEADWFIGSVKGDYIKNVFEQNGFEKFAALTTSDTTSFLNVDDDEDENGSGFIEFYVHIRAAKEGKVMLSSIEFETEEVEWVPGVGYLLGDNATEVSATDKVTYKVADAARVSLKVIADQSTPYIYQNNQANNEFDGDSGYSGNYLGQQCVNGALAVYNAKNEENQIEVPETTYEANEIKDLEGTAQELSTIAAYDNTNDTIVTIQVKVWIEGFDSECVNALFAQTLGVALGFEIEE